MDLREVGESKPEGHWYYENKFSIIFSGLPKEFIPRQIVEVGAGSKFFIQKILKKFPEAQGWAVDPYYSTNQLRPEHNLISTIEAPEVHADLYMFLDMLEHVENDRLLLTESTKFAAPKALIVVTVPAFQHLWSGHDIFLGHHRRYTKKSLNHVLQSSNFKVIKINYIFSILYPLALIIRKINGKKIESNMKDQSKITNMTVLRILSLLRVINSNKLFGLTVFAIAEKN